MTKTTTQEHTALTREVLVRELSLLEKRLDHRFDLQTESMKAHIDSRISQVTVRMVGMEKRMEERFDKLEKKLDVRVDGLVQLIETRAGETIRLEGRVQKLEAKVG